MQKLPHSAREDVPHRQHITPSNDDLASLESPVTDLQRTAGNNPQAHLHAQTGVQTAAIAGIVQRARMPRIAGAPAPTGDPFFRDRSQAPEPTHADDRPIASVQARAGIAGIIQRLAYNDLPYPDVSPTPNRTMSKSGTGADGVYFASDPTGRVVLKFLDAEGAFRTQVANKFMEIGTGLVAPNSRVIASGQPGNAQIKAAVFQHSQLDLPVTAPALMRNVNPRLKTDALADTSDPATAVVVMDNIQQMSLREMARTPGEHNHLVTLLLTPNVVEGFAKIIVADAILGNSDRFMKDMMPANPVVDVPANISNIFVSPDFQNAIALDNDTDRAQTFTDAQKGNLDQSLRNRTYLSRAMDNPLIATQLAEAVVCACMMDAGELAVGQVTPNLSATGMGPLSNLMHNYNVRNGFAALLGPAIRRQMKVVTDQMQENREQLRAAHAEAGAAAGFNNPNERIDYNQLRARAKYVEMLGDGKNDIQAVEKARKQLLHKEKKDNRQLGYQKAQDTASAAKDKVAGFFRK